TLAADLIDLRSCRLNRAQSFVLNFKCKPRRESNCSQHAQLVFRKTLAGVTDGANDSPMQVFPAANKIENRILDISGRIEPRGIEQHAVDGEVAQKNILLGKFRVGDRLGPAAILVGPVVAEGRSEEHTSE